ncbi:hypothetical protein CALCODRAFT_22027 [Calocera cornea HHB12733]|uniref:RGS domain-containing protein n=1 Tax=Calocera cornea HHB12733 TaxID=1353952 RepID=A0A165E537_9BASI|nr:hypothetical protein CALCODRAFT_22027 [Calocera cornea HHB12733]
MRLSLGLPTLRLPLFALPTAPTLPNPNPLSPSRRLTLTFLFTPVPIPADLSLEHVLGDTLCPPVSLADFHAFLSRTREQENLAFVLWFRDYEKRFWELDEAQRAGVQLVEPREEWEAYVRRKAEDRRREGLEKGPTGSERTGLPEGKAEGDGPKPWESIDLNALEAGPAEELVFAGENVLTEEQEQEPAQVDADTLAIAPWIVEEAEESDKARMREMMAGAEQELEKTVQLLMRDDLPLREEIVRAVLHFLTLSSPSALTSAHIPALLLTLRRTTHPYSFRLLYQELYTHLLLDAHPRFIRASLVNTRAPFRACLYVIALGLYLGGGLALGLALVLCPGAGGLSRAWRAFSVPLVWAGTASPLCLLNGICPLAFGTKRRQLSLWESRPAAAPGPTRPTSASSTAGSRSLKRQSTARASTSASASASARPARVGLLEFLVHDWWATHPAAREMQWAVMRAAAAWGALGMLLWAGVILGVPARG